MMDANFSKFFKFYNSKEFFFKVFIQELSMHFQNFILFNNHFKLFFCIFNLHYLEVNRINDWKVCFLILQLRQFFDVLLKVFNNIYRKIL